MSISEIILLCILFIVCVLLVILIINKIVENKRTNKLIDSINDFIDKGILTDLSLLDNNFARLQNSVVDLQTQLQLEKSNSNDTTKKNTEFISDISHQLKTPLAGLRLYCEMENEQNPTEHTNKELQLIEKMESLVYKLLRLEKIKSDSYNMDFKLYESQDIIKEVIIGFNHLFPLKNYVVSGNGLIRCDKDWLSEAIGNIIKNASEHTVENGIINIKIEDSANSTVIEINDNGGGLPEKELPNLFTRFYRTENSLPSSAGIGLAITKAIVEKHHGIISAENKNSGLSVIMCFPKIDGYITI